MKGKIKQPRHSGVVRVPQVIQMEDLECGAAALTMVLAYYNKWIPLEQVRRDCGISRDGSNADNVMRAAQGYGLTVELSHPDAEEIIHHGQFPCIIQWNDTHYLVLDGFRHGKAYVSDPAFGAYTVELENFGFCYTGTCLNFCPGESFEPSGKPKSIWRFARRKLAGCGAAFALVVISTVISSLTGRQAEEHLALCEAEAGRLRRGLRAGRDFHGDLLAHGLDHAGNDQGLLGQTAHRAKPRVVRPLHGHHGGAGRRRADGHLDRIRLLS